MYVVEMAPKKLWFDWYCSLECVKADLQEAWQDAEFVNRKTALELTGHGGEGMECAHCGHYVLQG